MSILDDRRRALEDQFFRKQNDASIEAMREKLARISNREQLIQVSGMSSDAVLDEFLNLGLTGDTLAALHLAPLVHVAWADGEIQQGEREAIMKGAAARGIAEDSDASALLQSWLTTPPTDDLFHAWKSFMDGLASEHLNEDQLTNVRTQILGFARGVAEAAGGILGMNTVSDSEKVALEQIESVLKP